jgi:hypothetical protein
MTSFSNDAPLDGEVVFSGVTGAIGPCDISAETLARFRAIAAEAAPSQQSNDEVIFLVGRMVQYVIDSKINRDSVQLARDFNEKSRSIRDSFSGSLPKSRKRKRVRSEGTQSSDQEGDL